MPRTPTDILSQEFLQTRAKVLELAAFYDRLAETGEGPADSRQIEMLHSACAILTDDQPNKAARVQLLFSRDYNPAWREEFGI